MTQTISQLEAAFIRQTPGQVGSIPLQVVVDDVLDILETEIVRQGTEIIRNKPTEELCVLANMVQIQQVFVNLITNALEAMEDSEHRVLTIHTRTTADKVRITIRDTGFGIPEQNLPRIFTPFFTTKKEGALGLGLLICSRIISNHKGTIRATNHPDGGAQFIIELPRDHSYEGVEA